MTVAIAQRILDRRWRHADAARTACREGSWATFVRSIMPPRPSFVGRLDHAKCLALAERSLEGPVTTRVSLVPLWACSTDDAPSDVWCAAHGIAAEGEALGVHEVGPFIDEEDVSPRADARWEITVRRWSASTVVTKRAFAPDIPMRLRAGDFAVYDIWVDEVVDVEVHASEALPRPTVEVPMFASWLAPRVTVSPEVEARIRALCFTATET